MINELKESQRSFNDSVKQIDPVNADDWIDVLPQLNAVSDQEALSNLLLSALTQLAQVESIDEVQAIAALRDIGLLAASLKRTGMEPTLVSEQLESTLLSLADITQLPPRDNVYTYALWNPQDTRQRTFTGTNEERLFIQAIEHWLTSLQDSFSSLIEVQQVGLLDESSPQKLRTVLSAIESMVAKIAEFRKQVPTAFFVEELQPYFQPFEVAGVSYEPPAGAHMNLLLLDYILWGSDSSNDIYQDYFFHNTSYVPGSLKATLKNLQGIDSISTVYNKAIEQLDHLNTIEKQYLFQSLEVLQDILTRIISFRRVHLKLAEEQSQIIDAKPLSQENILIQIVSECDAMRKKIGEGLKLNKAIRPLGTLSDFVVLEMPKKLDSMISTQEGQLLADLAEQVAKGVDAPMIEQLPENELLVARLDALLLEQAVAHNGEKPGPVLQALVNTLIEKSERAQGLTYEDLIFTNPKDDIRLFCTGAVGESEEEFYVGHMEIEERFMSIIELLSSIQFKLANDDFDSSVVSSFEQAVSLMEEAVEKMAFFMKELSPEHFALFAKFHDSHQYRIGTKGAGGQFSASIPIIDLLLSGNSISPEIREHWLANEMYMPQSQKSQLLGAFLIAENNQSIKQLLNTSRDSEKIRPLLKRLDTVIRKFRARHYRAVTTHIPEVQGGNMQSAGIRTSEFLQNHIAIDHANGS